MQLRPLGNSGLFVAPIALGAGPVSQLWVNDRRPEQLATLARAVELGVRWIDTAATYGEGRSEANLGAALSELGLHEEVQVATKVRIMPEHLGRLGEVTRSSLASSLQRLRRDRVTLLQIHNSITAKAGAEPTSLTPAHVLAPGGLLETLDEMRRAGLVEHLGLTGLGEPAALAEVLASGQFGTLQTPYHLLNPSAGHAAPQAFSETDFGQLITTCQRHGVGVFAIRVFAGGALTGQEPSPHTLKTPFFPLALFQRDRRRADRLAALLPAEMSLPEVAVRFALSHPGVSSAILGFASPEEVAAAVGFAYRGPLDAELLARLTVQAWQPAPLEQAGNLQEPVADQQEAREAKA